MAVASRSLEAFRAALDCVEDAGPTDTVAGVPARLVVRPGSADEVAATLAEATAHGLTVVARGGGTKLGWGRRPGRVDVLLDTGRVAGVVDVTPGDFVAVVHGGTRLLDLQAVLADAAGGGQRLPLDPPEGDLQTVAGIVAAAAAGPLRHRHGSPRDTVLGVRFALADGTLARAGSRVVKNVAGYDVAKLLCGSLGTLAVICELIVKLQPVPESRLALSAAVGDDAALAAVVDAIRASRLPVAVLHASLPVRRIGVVLESTAAGAEAIARRLRAITPLEPEPGAPEWIRPLADGCVGHVGFPTGRLRDLLAAIPAGADARIAVGPGIADVALPTDRTSVVDLRLAVEALGGHLTLRNAPPELDDLVFGSCDPGAASLLGSIRRQLDPTGTLAPGRLDGWVA